MASDSFWEGFEKAAAEKSDPEGHHLRRALLSNPISSAIEAEKGKKGKAFGNALLHSAKESIKGMGIGGAVGAAGGAAAGLLSKGRLKPGVGAGVGGLGGAMVGNMAGSIKGQHGAEASRIHGEYSKHKKG